MGSQLLKYPQYCWTSAGLFVTPPNTLPKYLDGLDCPFIVVFVFLKRTPVLFSVSTFFSVLCFNSPVFSDFFFILFHHQSPLENSLDCFWILGMICLVLVWFTRLPTFPLSGNILFQAPLINCVYNPVISCLDIFVSIFSWIPTIHFK